MPSYLGRNQPPGREVRGLCEKAGVGRTPGPWVLVGQETRLSLGMVRMESRALKTGSTDQGPC